MVKVAFVVPLEAKPGKEAEVEIFLHDGLSVVEEEPPLTAWFGIRRARGHSKGRLGFLRQLHPFTPVL